MITCDKDSQLEVLGSIPTPGTLFAMKDFVTGHKHRGGNILTKILKKIPSERESSKLSDDIIVLTLAPLDERQKNVFSKTRDAF